MSNQDREKKRNVGEQPLVSGHMRNTSVPGGLTEEKPPSTMRPAWSGSAPAECAVRSPILKLDHDDEERERAFELDYLLSLTTQQRLEMMEKRSNEIKRMLIRYGHRKPVEIIKRPCR